MSGEHTAKPWYKKAMWISVYTTAAAILLSLEIISRCSSVVISPIEASCAKFVTHIADTVSRANDAPIKRTLKRVKLELIRANANQEASMSPEELNVAHSKFRIDSMKDANRDEE